jgi:outer membrane receptor protein involved in Fe transport
MGATFVDTRAYDGAPLDDYLLFRIHTSYRLSDMVTLHARVENLTNQDYILADFGTPIQGAGLGFYTGVTAEF